MQVLEREIAISKNPRSGLFVALVDAMDMAGRSPDACNVVLAVLESSQLAPEVRFDTVSARAGLEVIEIARRSKVHGPRLL